MKYPGDVTENGPKTSAEVKNAWSCTSSPHTPADFGFITKHRDDFELCVCSYWIGKGLSLSFSYCRIEEKEQSTRRNTNVQPAAVLVTALAA